MSSPIDRLMLPRTTDRLLIRAATPDDVEPTWRFRQRPEVFEWITSGSSGPEEYRTRFLHPPRLAKTLVFELDGVVIGDLMLAAEDAWAQAEIEGLARGVQAELGWTLDPDHGGHGYATEAVAELIRMCFEDLGVRRVTASCFAANTPSWRLMERLGLRRELHSVRDSLHRSGQWLDGYMYALLADEWRAGPPVRRPEQPSTDRDSRRDWWGTVLDSPDPRALARFYSRLLGWQLSRESDTFCTLAPADGVAYLACQLSPDYVRPVWPNVIGEQQMMLHLDVEVTDLEGAVERARGLGGDLADHQPQPDVRVMLDPDGHPFCLYTS